MTQPPREFKFKVMLTKDKNGFDIIWDGACLAAGDFHTIEHSAYVALEQKLREEKANSLHEFNRCLELSAKLAAAEAEIERVHTFSREEGAKLFDSESENKRLRKALEWIATYKSWAGPNPDHAFEIAREALK